MSFHVSRLQEHIRSASPGFGNPVGMKRMSDLNVCRSGERRFADL